MLCRKALLPKFLSSTHQTNPWGKQRSRHVVELCAALKFSKFYEVIPESVKVLKVNRPQKCFKKLYLMHKSIELTQKRK